MNKVCVAFFFVAILANNSLTTNKVPQHQPCLSLLLLHCILNHVSKYLIIESTLPQAKVITKVYLILALWSKDITTKSKRDIHTVPAQSSITPHSSPASFCLLYSNLSFQHHTHPLCCCYFYFHTHTTICII